MYFKVVDGSGNETGYHCAFHRKRPQPDGSIVVELHGGDSDVPASVQLLPLDDERRQQDLSLPVAVFIVSDARDSSGNTVDKIWAPRSQNLTSNGSGK